MSVLAIVRYVIRPIAMCVKGVRMDGGEDSVKIDVLQTVQDLAVRETVGSVQGATVGGVSIVKINVRTVMFAPLKQDNVVFVIDHFGGMTAVRNVTMTLVSAIESPVSVMYVELEDGVKIVRNRPQSIALNVRNV